MLENLVCKYKIEGLNYIKDNNISEGKKSFIEGIKLNNKDSELLNLAGLCFYKNCEFNEAIIFFNKSIQLDNNKAKTYVNYLKSVKFKKILALYNRALEFLKENRLIEASNLLKKIIKKDEELIEPYCILIEIYLAKGEFEDAKKYLKVLLEKDRGNERISKYLKTFIEKI